MLDADDAYLPERLEQLILLGAEAGAHVVSDNILLRSEGVEFRDSPMFTPEQMPRNGLMTASRFVEGNIVDRNHQRVTYGFMKPVVRRDFIRQHSLQYDAGRFSEDYLHALRYLVHGAKWSVVPEPNHVYTIRPQSLTAKFAVEELYRLAAAEDRLLEDAPLAGDHRLAAAVQKHLRSVRMPLHGRYSWRRSRTSDPTVP